MRKIIVFVLMMIMSAATMSAARQDRILEGKANDKESGEPLEWATVAVRDAEGNVLACTTTDVQGRFKVNAQPCQNLTVSLIGYKDAVFALTEEICASVLDVKMEADRESLAAATVTEKVNLVEVKMDKVVMNVSQSAFAQGSNGLELIKKAPGVVIDKDGNVTLNGKTVSIWIDGRPSYMDGKSLEALLRSTDGGTIEKFEIMEHPSSKYDASGQGGIINIKTKKNALAGFNGSLGADGGGMYFKENDGHFLWQESAWLNLSYRSKKTNTFLNLYHGRYDVDVDIDIDTKTPTSLGFLEQESSSSMGFVTNAWTVKLGNDWFIDDRNTLGFILMFPGQKDCQDSSPEHNRTVQTIDGTPVTIDNTTINDDSRQLNASANLNYTHIFDESRSAEMTANLDYYHIGNNSLSRLDIATFHPITGENTALYRTIDTENGVDIYSAKLDYQSLLWKKVMFEAGAKWCLSNTDNETSRIEKGSSEMDLMTQFTYREHVAAAYFNAAMSLGPKWSVKAGLRAEYTNSYGNWKSAGESTRRSYLNLFPTVFAGFNPNAKWRFAASYTRRIERPGYFYLNPTVTYVDAHTWTVGNPSMKPQISDDVSLSIGFGSHLNLAAGYTHIGDWVMQVPHVLDNGDQYLEWGNFGKSNTAYLAFSVSALPITKWLDWTLNLTGMSMKTFSDGLDYSTSSLVGNAYTCFSFRLPKDWRFELDGKFTSPMEMGYYKMKIQWWSDFGVKKQLLDNRMTLSLNLNDVFRSRTANLDMKSQADGGVSSSYLGQKFYQQKLTVGVSWNFGKAQQPLRYRKVGNLEEASRAGSGKTIGN